MPEPDVISSEVDVESQPQPVEDIQMDIEQESDSESEMESEVEFNPFLFEVKTEEGRDEAIVFTIISFESQSQGINLDESVGGTSASTATGTSQSDNVSDLRIQIKNCGGHADILNPEIDNYQFEVPIVVPSNSGVTNLRCMSDYLNSLRQKGKMRDLFHFSFIADSIDEGRLMNLNTYQFLKSSFDKYDANEIMNLRTKWSELKPRGTNKKIPRQNITNSVIGEKDTEFGRDRTETPSSSPPMEPGSYSRSSGGNLDSAKSIHRPPCRRIPIRSTNFVPVLTNRPLIPQPLRTSTPYSDRTSASDSKQGQSVACRPLQHNRDIESPSGSSNSSAPLQLYSDSDDDISIVSSVNDSLQPHSHSRPDTPPARGSRRGSVSAESTDERGPKQRRMVPIEMSTRKAPPRRQKTYMSFADMQAVLDYVCKENLFEFVKGNAMWKALVGRKLIPGRTFHTLRNNFLKSILPEHKLCNFKISRADKATLSAVRDRRNWT